MAKKRFTTQGFDSLLKGEEEVKKIEINKPNKQEIEIRFTSLVEKNLMNQIKAISYWERIPIKNIIKRAFKEEIKKYEKLNGPIQEISQ